MKYFIAILLFVFTKYKLESISLINDNVNKRYGYLKYPYSIWNKEETKAYDYSYDYRYKEYDSRRYFKYPIPIWLYKFLKK